MLRAVAGKELLNHWVSFRFWAGALSAVLLAASSTRIAALDYNLRLSDYRERVAAAQSELRTVSVYSYLQPLLVRPPEALSVLDQGFDASLGTEVTIHLFAIPVEATGRQRGNEFLPSFPVVDLTRVVGVVLGLLALLLTCDAAIGEREDGTLRALLACGASRWQVLAGKLAGSLCAIALPLAAGLAVSLAVFQLTVATPLSGGQWLRVLGLTGAYGAYLSLMLLLGLFISLHVPNSSRALSVSLLVWFVLTIVIPGTAWAIAGDLLTPERARRQTERETAEAAAGLDRRLAERFRRSPLRATVSGHTAVSFASGEHRAVRYRYGSAAYYDALTDYYRYETAAGAIEAADVFALQQRYEARLRQGERLGAALATLSPTFLLDRLAESFSGTSLAEYDHFLAECRRYRLALLGYLGRKGAPRSWRWFTDDPPGGLKPWPRYLGLAPEEVGAERARQLFNRLSEPGVEARVRHDRAAIESDPSRRLSLDDMPRFRYRGPGLAGALRRGAAEGGALLLLNALAAIAVCVRFRHYELG
ncbi:MAG: ABC transporter permease subunit [Acidobacteriota bacterium]|nr:ABC transporter permease subunit [Acidobacteriota bacterium]